MVRPDDKRLEIRDEGVQRHKLRAGSVKCLEMMKIFLRQSFLYELALSLLMCVPSAMLRRANLPTVMLFKFGITAIFAYLG